MRKPQGLESRFMKSLQRTLKTAQGRDETTNCEVVIMLSTSLRRRMVMTELARSSEQERRVDARALIADEGRDKLRKAIGEPQVGHDP